MIENVIVLVNEESVRDLCGMLIKCLVVVGVLVVILFGVLVFFDYFVIFEELEVEVFM